MYKFLSCYLFLCLMLYACKGSDGDSLKDPTSEIKIAGAMKDVMRKGKLEGQLYLDTLKHKEFLQGMGPEAFLKGELLVIDGQSYVGRVLTDSTMTILRTFKVEAPFFVYAYVSEWKKEPLPVTVKSLKDLEKWLEHHRSSSAAPFVFKLTGSIAKAQIHLQNLPEGTKVSSPKEAHQGQKNYTIQEKEVEILGFFSKEHQGIFTHHDAFTHLHLITKDRTIMGHLDAIEFGDQPIMIYYPADKH
ncbi:acetolactate decarboxylase [Flavobacteriaceae bacterium M23B6Z8]